MGYKLTWRQSFCSCCMIKQKNRDFYLSKNLLELSEHFQIYCLKTNEVRVVEIGIHFVDLGCLFGLYACIIFYIHKFSFPYEAKHISFLNGFFLVCFGNFIISFFLPWMNKNHVLFLHWIVALCLSFLHLRFFITYSKNYLNEFHGCISKQLKLEKLPFFQYLQEFPMGLH